MNLVKCPPRPWGSEAGEYGEHTHHTATDRYRQAARCELHGVNVVDELPRRCPLATANPIATITQLRAAAWREIGKPWADPTSDHEAAHELLDHIEVCSRCLDRSLTHRTVRRLRRALGVGR